MEEKIDWEEYNALYAEIDINQIIPGMYVSSFYAAESEKRLKELGITHILQMGDFMDPKFPEKITYKVCPLLDFKDSNIKQYFEEGVNFIENCINGGGICLVHCNAGVSRSGTISCAYLMWRFKIGYSDALKMSQEKRPKISPNPGFLSQLAEYEKEILS